MAKPKSGIDVSGNLFNFLIEKYKLKNDADLARFLAVSQASVSRYRNGHYDQVSAEFIMNVRKKTRMSITAIEAELAKPVLLKLV